jgi:2-hydroxychromene-2-carboxylate isomerase
MAVLDFWFDFASTYSYPTALRIGGLAGKAGIEVRFRPFLLGPIFKAHGWNTSPFNLYPAKGRHMWRDLERTCDELKRPFRRPEPFPQPSLLAARVALVGLGDVWGKDFCVAVFRAEFADGEPIGEPATMRAILADLKVDPQRTMTAAQSDAIKERLRSQTAEAQRLEIFGAPTFMTADGELFWGNDRLENAIAWAKRAG